MAATTDRDFYKALQLDRSATADDIRKQYRKLALKYHPQKNRELIAENTFYEVTEAFHVLSDAQRRAVYDQYGMNGLVNGVPKRESYEGFDGKYSFHGDTMSVFNAFFGGDNPYADYFNQHFESPTALFGSKFGGLAGMGRGGEAPEQDPPIERELEITLEEAYNGNAIKRVSIVRRVLDTNGMTTSEVETVLSINVQPGWADGTRLVFPKEGDQGPNKIPADIVFTVKVKPHSTFVRDGNNLIYTSSIPLVQALTNSVITITTLDERILRIPINEIIHPGYVKEISGEGMPDVKNPSNHGKLLLKFNIKFPVALSQEKKDAIKAAFEQ